MEINKTWTHRPESYIVKPKPDIFGLSTFVQSYFLSWLIDCNSILFSYFYLIHVGSKFNTFANWRDKVYFCNEIFGAITWKNSTFRSLLLFYYICILRHFLLRWYSNIYIFIWMYEYICGITCWLNKRSTLVVIFRTIRALLI